jgi:hypothetical protein
MFGKRLKIIGHFTIKQAREKLAAINLIYNVNKIV